MIAFATNQMRWFAVASRRPPPVPAERKMKLNRIGTHIGNKCVVKGWRESGKVLLLLFPRGCCFQHLEHLELLLAT